MFKIPKLNPKQDAYNAMNMNMMCKKVEKKIDETKAPERPRKG